MADGSESERAFSKVLLSMWETSTDKRKASEIGQAKLGRSRSVPHAQTLLRRSPSDILKPPLCVVSKRPRLQKRKTVACIDELDSCVVSRRPRLQKKKTVASIDELEDELSFRLPSVRGGSLLANHVELRRAIFREARLTLREHELEQKTMFPDLSPLERFRLASNVVLRGTHIIMVENGVVELWKDAVEHAIKQNLIVGVISEDRRQELGVIGEDRRQESGSLETNSAKQIEDDEDQDDEVGTLLAEFEIMSGHIPSLKESKDFQRNAKLLIDMVHSSISTLHNLHDSASNVMDDSLKLGSQFSEGARRARELWNKIKDDVARIKKVRGTGDDAPVKHESVNKAAPKPFVKVVEHNLESLGIIRDKIRDVVKEGDIDKDGFNASLFAALGGGSYQRLVDWSDSLSELRCKRDGGQDDWDPTNDFFKFLDECNASSVQVPEKAAAADREPCLDPALTEDHVLTQRRFSKKEVAAAATPSELGDGGQETGLAMATLHTPPEYGDVCMKSRAGLATTPAESLSESTDDSCSSSAHEAASARRVSFDSETREMTELVACTSRPDEASALVPRPPSENRKHQRQFNIRNRHITQTVASTPQPDDSTLLTPKLPSGIPDLPEIANKRGDDTGNSSLSCRRASYSAPTPAKSRPQSGDDTGNSSLSCRGASFSDPTPAKSRPQSLPSQVSDTLESSQGVSQQEYHGMSLKEIEALSPRWISQNGRPLMVTGHSSRHSLAEGPVGRRDSLDDHDEDYNLPSPPRRNSFPVSSSSRNLVTVTAEGEDQSLSPRELELMVRGRSFSKSSVSSLPPLSKAAGRINVSVDLPPLSKAAGVNVSVDKAMTQWGMLKKRFTLPELVGRLKCMA